MKTCALIVCLFAVFGCGPDVVRTIDVRSDPGFFSTDLVCTNKGEQLANVDLYVTAYFEHGTSSGEGHYRKWLKDEAKKVSVSSGSGSLQRILLTGKGRLAVSEKPITIRLEAAMVPTGGSP